MNRPVVVITGSRSLTDPVQTITAFSRARQRTNYPYLHEMQQAVWLHGGANGVDAIVAGHLSGMHLDVDVLRPNWGAHPKNTAAFIRNQEMVQRAADAQGIVIAVWDGRSRGTRHTIECAAKLGVPVTIEVVYP
jgi:hypothetical protein